MTEISGDDTQVYVPSSMSYSRLAKIEAVVDQLFEQVVETDQLTFFEMDLETEEEIAVARDLILMLYTHIWDQWDTLKENPLQDSMETHW